MKVLQFPRRRADAPAWMIVRAGDKVMLRDGRFGYIRAVFHGNDGAKIDFSCGGIVERLAKPEMIEKIL